MIAVLLMKIAFLGRQYLLENGRSCTSKTSWGVGGGGLHDYLRLPRLPITDFAKQRKQRTRPILLSPFRTKERRRDVLHALFLEKLGKNGEKKYRAMFVY